MSFFVVVAPLVSFFLSYFTQRLLVVFFLNFLGYCCIKKKGRQLYKNYCLLTLFFVCVFCVGFLNKGRLRPTVEWDEKLICFCVFPTVVYEKKKETEKARIMCAKAEIKLLFVFVLLLLVFKIKMMYF